MEGSVVTVINAYILYLGIKNSCSCCSSKIQLLGSSDYNFLVGSKISAVWLLIFSPLLLFSYNPLHNRLTRKRFFWMETFRYNSEGFTYVSQKTWLLVTTNNTVQLSPSGVISLPLPFFILFISESCARLWIFNISKDTVQTLQMVLSEDSSLKGVKCKTGPSSLLSLYSHFLQHDFTAPFIRGLSLLLHP